MSYTSSLFHIVFCTKNRQSTLSPLHKDELHKYIIGIANNLRCDITCINSMPEHIHILVNLSADTSLSKFVAVVKQSSSLWLKKNIYFNAFEGWAKEYYGVSVSPSNKESVKGYIANQERHHATTDFRGEIRWLVEAIGEDFYENSFS